MAGLPEHPALALAIFLLSFALMAKVADTLVDAVKALSGHLRISEAVAGATLAAAATSAPELGTTVFSLLAITPGQREAGVVGIGSVIGSAIFNVAVIIGVVAILRTTQLSREVYHRDGIAYVISVVGFVLAVGVFGPRFTRLEAALLFIAYGGYVLWVIRDTMRTRYAESFGTTSKESEIAAAPEQSLRSAWTKFLVSVALVAVSCHALVHSTTTLVNFGAQFVDLSKTALASLVSLVAVAAGTSIPDLFTSIAAVRKGHGAMAISNALGSNTFDLLVGLGLPYAVLGGQPIPRRVVLSGWYLLGTVVVFLLVTFQRKRLGWREGVLLLLLYAAFLVLLFIRPMLELP